MDYSKMSDEELLNLYNGGSNTQTSQQPTQPNTDYSKMSDDELLSLYNGNKSTKTVSNPIQPNTSTMADKPVTLQGSVKKTTPYQWFRNNIRPAHFLGDLGKSTANAFREESIMGANAITGAKNWALDKIGLNKWHRPTEEVKAEREALIPKFDTNENAHVANFVGDMLGWAPMFAVGGEGIAAIKGGAKAAKVASVASKTGRTTEQAAKVLARREAINAASKKAAEDAFLKDASIMQQIIRPQTFANAAKTAHNAGMDMATFEGLRHGLRTLGGEEQENTFGQDVLQGYGMGAAFGGGASALGSVAKPVAKAIGKTKLAQDISGKVREVINSNDKISHAVANFKNAFNIGRNSKDSNVNKYRDFEKLLQESGLPEEEINANLLEYSNLSARDKIKVDKAVRKQLMEAKDRPSTEKPQFFGEEPTIQTKQPTLDDLINPSTNIVPTEQYAPKTTLEKLNKIEQAIDNGTPITKEAIYETTPNKFNPADDINLFGQVRDYNVPQNNIEYAQTPVSPKQPTLDLPKVKPNTKKTLAEWKSKYSKKNTSVEEGRPVESSEGINTPREGKTIQNDPSKSTQNENSVKELPKKIIEPEESLDNMKVTKLKPGEAEGSNTSYNKIERQKSTQEADAIQDGLTEEVPNSGKYSSEDAEFNKWYDKYEKSDANTRASMAEEKMSSFKTKEEGLSFYNKFANQVERDTQAAQRNAAESLVKEDDLLNFASKMKNVDSLPSATKEARIHNEELANKMQEMSGKQELEILGFGRNKNINTRIAKNIAKIDKNGYRTESGNKTLEYLAFGKLNKHNTRIGLDQMYKQIKNRIEKYKNEGFATTRIEEALDKAYARKLKELGIPMKEAKGIPQHIEGEGAYKTYKQNLKDRYGVKDYAYKDKTILGIDKVNSRIIDGELITATPSEKYSKVDYNKVHLARDYAEDFSSGNELVKNIIENSKVTFKFDDIGGHGYTDARNYNNITLNKNESLEDTIIAGRHEIGHILQKYIAEFDENMARIVEETEYANKCFNNACKGVSNKTISEYIKWDSLPEKELTKRLDKLSDIEKDKYWEITDSYNDYKYSEGEQLSVQASKGDYSGYGEENLQRVYNRRIGQDKQANNANKGQKPENGKEKGNSGDEPRIGDSIGELFSKHDGGRRSIRKTNEQPIGLKGIKEPNLKATKYQKYDKSSGMSIQDWIKEVKEVKKNYGLTDTKARALVNRAANEIKTASDETEKLLIKRGIITEEQAANRKKMVGSSTYIADTPEYLSDGSINLNKDYSDTKVGATGKREHRSVKNAHLEKLYKNTQAYSAQAKYVDSVMDYVEKEFSKPIKDGKVLSGYKPVNSKILSTAVFRKMSKEWYNTVSDGVDSIKKAFKNEEVAKGWEELYNRADKPDMQIPEEVFNSLFTGKGESAADWIERYGHKDFPKGIGKLVGAVHDAMMEKFKQRVLTSASFVMNNRIGNQIMIAAKSDNPGEYIKSLYDAFKIKDSDLPAGILESNIANEIKSFNIRKKYTGYAPLDNAFNLFGGQLLDTKTLKGMKKFNADVLNWFVGKPARGFAKLSDKVMRFNQKFENFERRQVFAKHIDKERRELVKRTGQKMITQQEFADQINKNSPLREAIIEDIQNTLGDYNNFSKFEKDYLKRVVPFYSWYRTISRHTYQLAKKNPTRAALIMYELDDIKNNSQEDLKEYQRGSIKTGVKNSLTGENLVINKMHAMPYMTFREDLGVNPFIQVPAEAIRGKKFFQDQEISNKRYARFYEGKDEKYYDTKTGTTLDKLPASTRIGYIGKQLLWNNAFPYFDNPMLDVNKTSGVFFNKFSKDASKKDKGQWHMYDKSYDATVFGGFNIGDKVGTAKYKGKYNQDKEKEVIRSGKSRYRNRTALLNRTLGLSIQNENPKDYFSEKEEKESLSHKLSVARRIKAWKQKHKKNK